jgi:serine O-acetyltransferase
MMKLSLKREKLVGYVQRQFETFFPDGIIAGDLPRVISGALERVEHCFSKIGVKGYSNKSGAIFHHLHTDQYAVFLYYLSNSAFRAGSQPIAEKAYALNKALHALDVFYEVELPPVMLLVHPVGTVLGRAKYDDYFCCYQNCTTGANLENVYPVFGCGTVMYGGSRIIGRTSLGDNAFIATGTIAIDEGPLAPNSVIHGEHPNMKTSPTSRNVIREIFKSGD